MDRIVEQRLRDEERWIDDMREEIPFLAQTVAEEVNDRLEALITKETKDGWIFDTHEDFQRFLEMDLSEAFETSIERIWLSILRERGKRLDMVVGEAWSFDAEAQALDSLRKSIRLLPKAKPLLERMFRRAKPGAFVQIFRAVVNDVEDMEKEWSEDGEALRSAFAALRPEIETLVAKAASDWIQKSCIQYRRAVENADLVLSGAAGDAQTWEKR